MNSTSNCDCCSISMDRCNYSRRCFITGEYCSKQQLIRQERKQLHDKREINAFVIMNFSGMSDIVFNWRIQDFVQNLKENLLFEMKDNKIQALYCYPNANDAKKQTKKTEQTEQTEQTAGDITFESIADIQVIRADTSYASNFVMCNRVCQQMQIADLIIVDVSVENANVFYELGMCMAMGKLILPICYTNSYFARQVPQPLRENSSKLHENRYQEKNLKPLLHIGCYPWRKRLFEYYGIRYRNEKKGKEIDTLRESFSDRFEWKFDDYIEDLRVTKYIPYTDAVNPAYGFEDEHYNHFPYREAHVSEGNIGKQIYERLRHSYNHAGYTDNTLIIYTIDGFENADQAGQCMINYYKYMTLQLERFGCFCGDRVGTLVQENKIPESAKDSRDGKDLIYNVSEAIHIGTNHATYTAYKAKINSPDQIDYQEDGLLNLKEHLGNRSLMIYPDKPVYVRRVRSGIQLDLLQCDSYESLERFYCLYHVMLRNLKYVREMVIDISANSSQALFWLGVAHGADIYAITVKREETDTERLALTGTAKKKERNLFDVSGLWTAMFQTGHVNDFYRQLALAQMGIDYHSKLMVKNVDEYYKVLLDPLNVISYWHDRENPEKNALDSECRLESYYRSKLWGALRKQNRLWLYLSHTHADNSVGNDPKVFIAKWDLNAAGRLSNYLSKRALIGEYHIYTLEEGKPHVEADILSFISIGTNTNPLKTSCKNRTANSLTDQINEKIGDLNESQKKKIDEQMKELTWLNVLHQKIDDSPRGSNDHIMLYRGFQPYPNSPSQSYILPFPYTEKCIKCHFRGVCFSSGDIASARSLPCKRAMSENRVEPCVEAAIPDMCQECKINKSYIRDMKHLENQTNILIHKQMAQLILWRDIQSNTADPSREDYSDVYADDIYYRIALNGVSGPATEALTMLLIDPEDEQEIRRSHALLCRLQEQIRKQFLELYQKRIGTDSKSLLYKNIEAYLKGILYQYAFPFLSRWEEQQILNGLEFYLRSHREELLQSNHGKDSFETAIHSYIQELQNLLRGFQGVEAFYEVTVLIEPEDSNENIKDNREILCIRPYKKNNSAVVNCIFL